jgi:hypothetical protein
MGNAQLSRRQPIHPQLPLWTALRTFGGNWTKTAERGPRVSGTLGIGGVKTVSYTSSASRGLESVGIALLWNAELPSVVKGQHSSGQYYRALRGPRSLPLLVVVVLRIFDNDIRSCTFLVLQLEGVVHCFAQVLYGCPWRPWAKTLLATCQPLTGACTHPSTHPSAGGWTPAAIAQFVDLDEPVSETLAFMTRH